MTSGTGNIKLIPAIKGHMGSIDEGWDYYSCTMKMSELAYHIKFASDVNNDHTLAEAIQRKLNGSRANKEIATYLSSQPQRFFGSLVCAVYKGNPKWKSISIDNDPSLDLYRESVRNKMGLLILDGTEKIYALDGQHRLAAIKNLILEDAPEGDGEVPPKPEGFDDEEVSVVLIIGTNDEPMSDPEWMKRYRRLFGGLNRYAKPTSKAENYIIDEDDYVAISTRLLMDSNSLFNFGNSRQIDEDSQYFIDLNCANSSSITANSPYFTNLNILYAMNTTLLASADRNNNKWDRTPPDLKIRPSEDDIMEYWEELDNIWSALNEILNLSKINAVDVRSFEAVDANNKNISNILVRPVWQKQLAKLTRKLLNKNLSHISQDPSNPSQREIKKALKPLNYVNWNTMSSPWKGLINKYIPLNSETNKPAHYVICSEKEIGTILTSVMNYICLNETYSADRLRRLRDDYRSNLKINPSELAVNEKLESMWNEIVEMRSVINDNCY